MCGPYLKEPSVKMQAIVTRYNTIGRRYNFMIMWLFSVLLRTFVNSWSSVMKTQPHNDNFWPKVKTYPLQQHSLTLGQFPSPQFLPGYSRRLLYADTHPTHTYLSRSTCFKSYWLHNCCPCLHPSCCHLSPYCHFLCYCHCLGFQQGFWYSPSFKSLPSSTSQTTLLIGFRTIYRTTITLLSTTIIESANCLCQYNPGVWCRAIIIYVVEAADLDTVTLGNLLCKYADDTYIIIPASNSHTRLAEIEHIDSWTKGGRAINVINSYSTTV